jgi:hypothetical protein
MIGTSMGMWVWKIEHGTWRRCRFGMGEVEKVRLGKYRDDERLKVLLRKQASEENRIPCH